MKDNSRELFLKGCNCAQSVFCPYAQNFGIDKETALRLSLPLGAGVGRMRNVCGAFSAIAMICSLKFAKGFPEESQKEEIYILTQNLAEIFKQENKSIICAELLDLAENAKISPIPQKRDDEYYATRPCLRIVESAAKIIENYILANDISRLKAILNTQNKYEEINKH